MKQLRGRSLGTRLSEAGYAQCEQSAAQRGQTLSEWCRGVLLEAATDRGPAPEAVATLAEIVALRKILINLLYGERTGEPLDEGRMGLGVSANDAMLIGDLNVVVGGWRGTAAQDLADRRNA